MKFNLKLPNNILEKKGLEGHSKLRVTTKYHESLTKIVDQLGTGVACQTRKTVFFPKLKLNFILT